ncbi:Hypothetical protein A7982_01709 [Minicystis rosea]|nr:Hypothetical protein A7982_01709 [Minicystis rosea]
MQASSAFRAKDLIKRVATDPTLRAALSAAQTVEDKRKVLDDNGFADVTAEDLQRAAPPAVRREAPNRATTTSTTTTTVFAVASAAVAGA